jgi:hypothetical protein
LKKVQLIASNYRQLMFCKIKEKLTILSGGIVDGKSVSGARRNNIVRHVSDSGPMESVQSINKTFGV